jgi:hypothetical protein
MKINSDIRTAQTVATPESEVQNQTPSNPSRDTASPVLKENEALKLGQQRIATEVKGFSNLSAGLLQRSLASALPTRNEMLNKAAKELTPKLPQMLIRSGTDPDNFISAVREELTAPSYQGLGNMNGQDIEALAFIVLMQASKSAQEDLKSIMASVKSINNAKAKMRELLAQAQKSSSKDDDD